MATKSKRHPHKYYRVELPGQIVWACASGDCPHHMPPHYEQLLLNKQFVCWNCGSTNSNILPEHLKLKPEYFLSIDDPTFVSHPICRNCALNIKIDEDDELPTASADEAIKQLPSNATLHRIFNEIGYKDDK